MNNNVFSCILGFFLGVENERVRSANPNSVSYLRNKYTPTPNYHVIIILRALRAELALSITMSHSVPRCCSVASCATAVKQSLHTLPVDSDRRDQWLNFIYKDNVIPSVISPRLRVCSAHFTDNSFTNLAQVNFGFAKKRTLKPGAVPTIYPDDTESSTSGQSGVLLLPVS